MKKIIIPSFVEITLLVIVVLFLIFGVLNPFYREISKLCILITIYYWALLVLFGLLTPYIKHKFNLAFDINPEDNRLGYPIAISLESKGGFICNHPIVVKAEIIDIGTPQERGQTYKTKQLFKENFQEFSVIWSSAKSYQREKSSSLKDRLDIGGVELNMKKCSGKSSIIFTSPGKQCCRLMYKTADGVPVTCPPPKEEDLPYAFLYVSPPEILYQIRTGNIIYGLLLIILSFWLWSILGKIW